MSDQATQLRRLVRVSASPRRRTIDTVPGLWPRPTPARLAPPPTRLGHAIAVTSGKGGVGKTNIAVNLGVALARLGRRVCLLDADLGLANADVLCGLTPRLTLEHVVSGRCRLAESMLLAPGGFRLHFLYGLHHRREVIERKLARKRAGRKTEHLRHATQDELSDTELRRRVRWLMEVLAYRAQHLTPDTRAPARWR